MDKLNSILRQQKILFAGDKVDSLLGYSDILYTAAEQAIYDILIKQARTTEAPEAKIEKEKSAGNRRNKLRQFLLRTVGYHKNMRVTIQRAQKQVDKIQRLAAKAEKILINNRKKLGKAFVQRLIAERPDIPEESLKGYQGKYQLIVDQYLQRAAEVSDAAQSMQKLLRETLTILEQTKPTLKPEPISLSKILRKLLRLQPKLSPIEKARLMSRQRIEDTLDIRRKFIKDKPENQDIINDIYRGSRYWLPQHGLALREDLSRRESQQKIEEYIESGNKKHLLELIEPDSREKATDAVLEDMVSDILLTTGSPKTEAELKTRKIIAFFGSFLDKVNNIYQEIIEGLDVLEKVYFGKETKLREYADELVSAYRLKPKYQHWSALYSRLYGRADGILFKTMEEGLIPQIRRFVKQLDYIADHAEEKPTFDETVDDISLLAKQLQKAKTPPEIEEEEQPKEEQPKEEQPKPKPAAESEIPKAPEQIVLDSVKKALKIIDQESVKQFNVEALDEVLASALKYTEQFAPTPNKDSEAFLSFSKRRIVVAIHDPTTSKVFESLQAGDQQQAYREVHKVLSTLFLSTLAQLMDQKNADALRNLTKVKSLWDRELKPVVQVMQGTREFSDLAQLIKAPEAQQEVEFKQQKDKNKKLWRRPDRPSKDDIKAIETAKEYTKRAIQELARKGNAEKKLQALDVLLAQIEKIVDLLGYRGEQTATKSQGLNKYSAATTFNATEQLKTALEGLLKQLTDSKPHIKRIKEVFANLKALWDTGLRDSVWKQLKGAEVPTADKKVKTLLTKWQRLVEKLKTAKTEQVIKEQKLSGKEVSKEKLEERVAFYVAEIKKLTGKVPEQLITESAVQ